MGTLLKNLKEKALFTCILHNYLHFAPSLAQDYFFLRPLLLTVSSEFGRLILASGSLLIPSSQQWRLAYTLGVPLTPIMPHSFSSEQSAQIRLLFFFSHGEIRQLCYSWSIPKVMISCTTGNRTKLHSDSMFGIVSQPAYAKPPPSPPKNPPIPCSAPAIMLKHHSLLTLCLFCTVWFGIVPAVPLDCKLLGTGTCYVFGTLHLLYSAVYSSAI